MKIKDFRVGRAKKQAISGFSSLRTLRRCGLNIIGAEAP